MSIAVTLIGFGEAGMTFAAGLRPPVAVYDRKTDDEAARDAKLADYARLEVAGRATNQAAVADASLIVSLVTADQALAAACETARSIAAGALFCDLNSVAPDTKRLAADAIHRAGGRYADVAVMAPVRPGGLAVPLLAAGPHAEAAAAALTAIGFTQVRVVSREIGAASAVKMIRSVMVKGLEALTSECVIAAQAAGVHNEVIASLNASWPDTDWMAKADYNLDRMMVHGLRRAEEMEEVVRTLEALDCDATMSRGTARRQRAIGRMMLDPRQSLTGKIAAISEHADAAGAVDAAGPTHR